PIGRELDAAKQRVGQAAYGPAEELDRGSGALTAPPPGEVTGGIVGEVAWRAGDRVRHPRFGEGIVVTSPLEKVDEWVTVAVDERNEVVTRVARETDYATVAKREEGAFQAFGERLAAVDPELLADRDADGDTLEEIIAFDGADHYREHTLDIRAWFDGKDAPDEADAD